MAILLSGKEVAAAMNEESRRMAMPMRTTGTAPTLAIVRVGEKPADLAYEKSLVKTCDEYHFRKKLCPLPENVTEELLLAHIHLLNKDPEVHGILLLRPLPEGIEEARICSAIAPEKDLDGVGQAAMAGIYAGAADVFAPCTAQACLEILKHYGYELRGKRVAVLGRSTVIGKPVAMLLLAEDATVTVLHSRSEGAAEICRQADILIAAAGKAALVGPDYTDPGQIVLDVGINRGADGKLCGDVDFAAVEPLVSAITPVPGGVGSVTTAVLLRHLVEAAQAEADRKNAELF